MPPIYVYSVIIVSLQICNFNELFCILHAYKTYVHQEKIIFFFLSVVFYLLSRYNNKRISMKKSEKIRKKINDYLFDHRALRIGLDHFNAFLHASIAALIFAFGFAAFISPADESSMHIATGGVSGVSQTIALILKALNAPEWLTGNNVISIAYFVVNVPIITFAFFKIGKRFALYTLVNVGLSSAFLFLFSHNGFASTIAASPFIADHVLVRVLFGSLTVGISSAFAYLGDVSCGGIDVFSYYFALRKSTSIGKYGILINGIIITTYSFISVITDKSHWEVGFVVFFFSLLYLFVTNTVVDAINLRNKKMQVEIITNSEYLAPVLIANFPHGATIVKGEGAYSHTSKLIVYMVVSSSQVKSVIALAKRVDPHAFIAVTALVQVYGNFFIKPVE